MMRSRSLGALAALALSLTVLSSCTSQQVGLMEDPDAGIDDCDPYVPPVMGRGDAVSMQSVPTRPGEEAAVLFYPELLTAAHNGRVLKLGLTDVANNTVDLGPRRVYRVGFIPETPNTPAQAVVTRFPQVGAWSQTIQAEQVPNGIGFSGQIVLSAGPGYSGYEVEQISVYADSSIFTLDLWRP